MDSPAHLSVPETLSAIDARQSHQPSHTQHLDSSRAHTFVIVSADIGTQAVIGALGLLTGGVRSSDSRRHGRNCRGDLHRDAAAPPE